MNKELLRRIPRTDELIGAVSGRMPEASDAAVREAVRATLDELRADLLTERETELPDMDTLCIRAAARARRFGWPSLRPVINATGVVLHTNLGRACLSERAAAAAAAAATRYSTLEYDADTGLRGSRGAHVESLLCRLTGAESAMVVNNNAAAVLLLLTALTSGGEVVVSRGELVEIGGSFRIPDIMESCGAALREVGTTNKTRLADYASAIGERTRALMKVHTSNYRIVGFTESVSREELSTLGRKAGLPVFEDLGSGSLLALDAYGVADEPVVGDSIRAGVDVVTCSGDKLLGGPQAGILVGRKRYLEVLKAHPLTRALRVDKMTLAALEATLRSYTEGTAMEELPVLSMLSVSPEKLREEAQRLCAALVRAGVTAEVVGQEDCVGGGSAPLQRLASFAVAVTPKTCSVKEFADRLREREKPVVAHTAHEKVLLSVRTLRPDELDEVVRAAAEAEQ